MSKKLLAVLAMALSLAGPVLAQQNVSPANPSGNPKIDLRYNLSEDGSKYIKATFLNQAWLRWTENNPGTTVNGAPQDNTFDIGLRRTRLQLFGQISDHVFIYTQFGMNNFNYLAQNAGNRKLQAFFHDAVIEYKLFKDSNALKVGTGLTIANGLSRFSQPSTGTAMTTDVPVFAQATVDQTDEFSRKLSVYARGQVGKIDYRVALSDPFPIQTSGRAAPTLGQEASFTTYGHTKQYQGFFIYNILEREPHILPLMAGTYLGERSVLNLEGGVIYQRDATWNLNTTGTDTTFNNMLLWSAAVFADLPVQDNKFALSAYAGYFNTDYGQNYIRNNGIMNPANGNMNPQDFSGAGNAYPMFGTGESVYTQAGLRLPNNMLGAYGTLMPYASYRRSDYERLADPVEVWDAGIHWLINKHASKISFNYQLRPVFEQQTDGGVVKTSNASSAWVQYQVNF